MNKLKRRIFLFFCALAAVAAEVTNCWAVSAEGIEGRLIVGYQGWFGCPGDYEGNADWVHLFFNDIPDVNNLSIDLLPSVTAFNQADLFKTDMHRPDGSPVYLYSAQNANVVETHFKWMADNGIDGAAVQRFIGPVAEVPALKARSDNVIMNARAGAEDNGRVFFITYDVSGANPATVISDIEADWQHLVNDLQITASSSYLHVNGKPVLEIWGFGFTDRPGSPDDVTGLIQELKTGSNGLEAATVIGGVPGNWRTLNGDSKSDRHWAPTYRSYDIISPWSVGRFTNDAGTDAFVRSHVLGDVAVTKRLGIGYMPVIFPGFSWYNLMKGRGETKLAIPNQIPRQGGNFLWHQVYDLLKGAGVKMLYGAMFDEVDEGTALFPVEAQKDNLPEGANMVYLDEDGYSLPDDWYLRIVGKAAEFLRTGASPPKRLGAVLGN